MEAKKREARIKIVTEELYTLETKGYLSEKIVETVVNAHHQYHMDLLDKEADQEPVPDSKQISHKPVSVKPPKVKKSLTPEEVRERNITWSLNIGVIFLLIGGLFVATSNWESMSSMMKSGSIAIVALLFYGLSALSNKILHINKTAFAFTVLGSLFLPIFILSLGWFGLLGPYLSINGDGRYLLGVLGSLVPAIVYLLLAQKLAARLFVWFTYVSISAGAAFLLAWFNLEIDLFYFGLMAFNGILIFLYHRLKTKETVKLFTTEFAPFVQVNLVLCTLFMLFLYENKILYSFNLLLTAIIYLSMIYVSGRKEYHFVFSTMIVYGAYQLIEHSFLESFGAMIYAAIAFAIVLVPKITSDYFALNKVFQYTSAIISGIAFVYISLQGILLRAGTPSVVLMLSYLIMAANFLYLSHQGLKKLFPYLSSAFLASAFYQGISLMMEPFQHIHVPFSLFLTGFILFLAVGTIQLTNYMKLIQNSSKDVGIAIMVAAILIALNFMYWTELGFMLLLFVIVSYLVHKRENRFYYRESALWVLPFSLGFAVVSFGEEFISKFQLYEQQYGYAVNFAGAALLVLLSSIGWNKVKDAKLSQISLFISQILYTLAMAYAVISPINHLWVQQLVFLGGVGMYIYLYKNIEAGWVPFFISLAVLFSYFSLVDSIASKIQFSQTANSFIASMSAVLVLLIAFLYRKKDKKIATAFAWIGHGFYPFALLFTYLAYNNKAYYSFIVAAIVYGMSTRYATKNLIIKGFLYGSFTSLFFAISTGLNSLITDYLGHYEFLITSVLIFICWWIANPDFKKSTTYYLVPFSMIGIISTLLTYPFNWQPYIVTVIYCAGILLFLHKIKWDLLGFIPLLLAFLATVEFTFFSGMDQVENLLFSGAVGILTALIGQIVYRKLVAAGTKLQEMRIDSYTLISCFYFLFMFSFVNHQIWTQALPGILGSIVIWMQRKRVAENASVFVVILSGVCLLQPYYAVFNGLNIPALWAREGIVLPWIILVIVVRLILKEKYSMVTKPIEWGILLIVSFLLIQDGLSSSTINDALILGSLSLISMLSGMFFQVKSYFFVGSGVLLLNVFLQTRPYWGKMPWWAYLLIVGFILIIVASFNEWNKQKIQKGESTFIMTFKNKMINKLKQWN